MLKLYYDYEQQYPDSIGLLYSFIASFSIFGQQLIVKFEATTYGPGQMAYIRFLYLLILNGLAAKHSNVDVYPPKNKLTLMTIRNMSGALCTPILYWALNKIPLWECSIFSQIIPIIVPLFDLIYYRTKYTTIEMVLAVMAVGGVFMVVNYENDGGQYVEGMHLVFVLMVMLFGYTFLYAVSVILIKEMKDVSSTTINLGFALFGIIFGSLKQLSDPFINASLYDFCTVGLSLGLVGSISQFCFIKSYQLAKPGRVSIINSSHIVLAFLVEYYAYGTSPDVIQILGVIIIVGSVIGTIKLKN